MRRWLAFASVFALVAPAAVRAIPVWPVMDTSSFVEKAKDVVVVRCIDPDAGGDGGAKVDGLTLVEVEVLAVVKGGRKVGKARLATIGQPMAAGSRYLMASFGGDALGTGFLAQSDQSVVELPDGFGLKALEGLPAAEVTAAVFKARKEQVGRMLLRLRREKEMLERAEAGPSSSE